ncbi:hypothetical protein BCV69DRAFT_247183 [Microstroma glucosiphilum]|uniref:Uncharacterized protein n=1 Tax=Pseudomicrostroma glucosiphilum TaxID=1684307 RepID=A0A316U9N9_9BASI|nr:hypothetical protein BCV69DRAFT_247183 [Pseudomicrostroma glucosiphilum]PWN21950.1 hypothetical protein BCV69DRAFT_247183 [Pseudomicrostroma glucosiphilum]
MAENLNDKVAASAVGRWFRLDGCGHPLERKGSRFTTELRAGLVTFTAMAYILSVNASILSDTGGTCPCTIDDCDSDPAFAVCKNELRQDYVVATAAMSFVSTFLMSVLANLPLGLAPGLGVNAYLAYSVVGYNGFGGLTTFGGAFAAVFLEGWLFFFLSVFGLRQMIGRLLPRSLALATGAGIGAFLAFIGLGPNGLAVIGGDTTNLIGLGGCLAEYQDPDLPNYCLSHVLQDPRIWAGIFGGGVFTALLLMYRVRGALLWPILLVSIAAWPRTSGITLFPHTEAGDQAFDFFKNVATWHSFTHLGPSNIEWSSYGSGRVWLALITFLYTDALDTTATLFSMSRHAGLFDDTTADFEGSSVAFLVDAFCIAIGALMNLSPCTAFIESASGITEGGRTGITGVTISFFFFLSLFFAPIFASFPDYATGATLFIVGSMMIRNTSMINWGFVGDAIPAFLTIILMPLTNSIAYGVIAGIISWMILHIVPQLVTLITFGKVPLPEGWDTDKELYDVWLGVDERGVKGAFKLVLPPWMQRLIRGKKRFWEMDYDEMMAYKAGRELTIAKAQAIEEQRRQERQDLASRRKGASAARYNSDDSDSYAAGETKMPLNDDVGRVPHFGQQDPSSSVGKGRASLDDLEGRN